MPYSMLQLPCCCVSGCTHNYRVFVPCAETPASKELVMPVTHKDNLDEYGLEVGKIYHYDALICENYCGSWQCVEGADNGDNWCDRNQNGYPPCECQDWEDQVDPPYMYLRPTEWTTNMAARWTDLDVNNCCDAPPILCDVDCGFGDVIPSDCSAPGCYDPALIGWSVQSVYSQDRSATAVYVAQYDGCTNTVPYGTQITTDLSAEMVSADSYIVGSTLYITWLVKYTTTTSPLYWAEWCDPDNPPCCAPCVWYDPDCSGVFGNTFERHYRYIIQVPCMEPPRFATCYDPADPTTCAVPSNSPDRVCGFGPAPPGYLESWNPLSFPGGTAPTESHAIGWGGNATCYVRTAGINWGVPTWCYEDLSSQQNGVGEITFVVRLSLPGRPAGCP